jgi:ribosomal subunit interface protein
MTLRISGKNLDIGEALRGQIETRIEQMFAKYFDGTYSGHVTITKDGTGFRAEAIFHLATGVTLQANGAAHDAYAAFDGAAERIEKRLSRYKRRLKSHRAPEPVGVMETAAAYVIAAPEYDEEEPDEGYNPVIIAESSRALNRFSVSEAVTELDLSGKAALVFRHAGHGRINVVYRRSDGNIGWIDPSVDGS